MCRPDPFPPLGVAASGLRASGSGLRVSVLGVWGVEGFGFGVDLGFRVWGVWGVRGTDEDADILLKGSQASTTSFSRR